MTAKITNYNRGRLLTGPGRYGGLARRPYDRFTGSRSSVRKVMLEV